MITRLAPTPSGFIHIGNIYNLLLNWLWAKSNNGQIVLRIDDLDAERKKTEYVEDVFRVLHWLGLDWDIGPTGPDDFEANWSQLNRADMYADMLTQLIDKHLLYACACSRWQQCTCHTKQIPLSTPGVCWKMSIAGNPAILLDDKMQGNLSIPIEAPFVVKRKNGMASYQIASLADDRHFNITHICRGADLLPSTAMQCYIDGQLNTSYFSRCTFWHHPLLTNSDGTKLSKSAGSLRQSIIHQLDKKNLLASFAQWMKINRTRITEPKDMIGMEPFITT